MPLGGIVTASLIGGAGALAGGGLSAWGATSAADKQAQALQQALAYAKKSSAPFVGLGTNAVNQLQSLYGMGGPSSGGTPGAMAPTSGGGYNWDQFVNSPDYQWARNQGTLATQNVLSAQGNLLGGGGLTALTNYGQGLASQQFQNYVGRLLAMANLGSNANSATLGNITGTQGNIGTAGAMGTLGMVGGINSGLTGAGNAASGYVTNNILLSLLNKQNPGGGGSNAWQGSAFTAPTGAMAPTSGMGFNWSGS